MRRESCRPQMMSRHFDKKKKSSRNLNHINKGILVVNVSVTLFHSKSKRFKRENGESRKEGEG